MTANAATPCGLLRDDNKPLMVDGARRALAAQLRAAGIETPELDARMLVCDATGLDLTALIRAGDRILSNDERAHLQISAERRLAGEPVARILGIKEFWGLDFELSAATLIPRPDTEAVVRAGLACLADVTAPQIADLATGSGAILLALLSELPLAQGVGTDISVAALQTACANAVRLGLASRALFVACDYAAALGGRFDLIVSNPPYIRTAEIAGLAREVRDHDPHLALDGGPDGLQAYRVIAPVATRCLTPGGALIVEVGADQYDAVSGLLAGAGFGVADAPLLDLSGIRRAVLARKKP